MIDGALSYRFGLYRTLKGLSELGNARAPTNHADMDSKRSARKRFDRVLREIKPIACRCYVEILQCMPTEATSGNL